MTIRVEVKNCDDVVLYVEDQAGLRQLQPGETGTFYVKKDNRIQLREDMRAKDRCTNKAAPDRRQRERRFS